MIELIIGIIFIGMIVEIIRLIYYVVIALGSIVVIIACFFLICWIILMFFFWTCNQLNFFIKKRSDSILLLDIKKIKPHHDFLIKSKDNLAQKIKELHQIISIDQKLSLNLYLPGINSGYETEIVKFINELKNYNGMKTIYIYDSVIDINILLIALFCDKIYLKNNTVTNFKISLFAKKIKMIKNLIQDNFIENQSENISFIDTINNIIIDSYAPLKDNFEQIFDLKNDIFYAVTSNLYFDEIKDNIIEIKISELYHSKFNYF